MTVRWWLILLVSCGGEPTDEDRIDAVLDLEGDAGHGEEVYAASCESCHGADGTADDGALAGADLRGVTADRVVEAVVVPPAGMLTFDTMPDQDIADVAAHASSF